MLVAPAYLAAQSAKVVQTQAAQTQAAPSQEVSGQADDNLVDDGTTDSLRVNLGSSINTNESELFPLVTPDENMLFFTEKGSPQNTGFAGRPDDEDIWYSLRQPDGSWGKAMKLEGPLNTKTYDGIRAINSSADKLYLQNIYLKDGSKRKGFSVSEKGPNGIWSYPDSLHIEDYYNDTTNAMMTISNDEKVIVFSLKRKDSKGKHDLYISRNIGVRKWSAPIPIESLNTVGDEISPFIAYDDHTMYFSTDGRKGYGLQDVFMTRRLDDTWLNWSEPVNLGPPVNTPSFDSYFSLSARGDTAYFSSAHESSTRGFGKSDIWKVGLAKEFRPGYGMPQPTAKKEENLIGTTFRLEGLLFDVSKSTIRSTSMPVLDKLLALMNEHPHLMIEVQGHTDSDGDPEENMRLSKSRAETVRDYLIKNGIEADRVDAKGYGMTQPIAPNSTSEGKQLNRRVMVFVKGNKPADRTMR